ncbi:Na+/H+ antiporter NhaC family protein [Anaerovorax odorimutans]|uniref:Na+/H+ antiporter NhaC family protein n=1 Tax=Anaerovorax odorimutans TaxID=109327 RepID=UPI0003FBD480|nr:Na+/H+ antiporter NhaC family protein [Anaerovorax odorimutans]
MDAITNYGALSLLPVAVVIISAIITKRALEPLILGTMVGFIIIAKEKFVFSYLDSLYGELGESAYFIIIFGLFGIFIKLLETSNAISGFTKLGLRFANNKKKTGILTWVMGIVLFLDNYFSILGAGVSSRKIADENKMSREMFSFAVNAVACSTCILVPLSLWGVFMGSQIEDLNLLPGTGIDAVVKAVPFMFFAWMSLLFVLLYQLRIIKPFGPMKLAEERAETTGEVLPADSLAVEVAEEEEKKVTSVWNFAAPMIILIGITLWTQELTYGLLTGILVCLILYIPQKLLKFGEAFDSIWAGFQDMFVVTAIVISAFVLQNANDELGLAPYVIETVSPIISVNLLPLIAFIVLLVLGFVTGSFWGMAAVCFPIMIPLANTLGANMYLTIGAVIAGSAAGSATCFYGDSVTLTCGLAKIKNIDYARTALPMIVPILIITSILYLIAGFIL